MDRAADAVDAAPWLQLLEQYKAASAAHSPSAALVASELETYTHLEAHLTLLSQQLARDASLRQPFVDSTSFSSVLNALDAFFPVFQQIQNDRPCPKEHKKDALQNHQPSMRAQEQDAEQNAYQRACHIATMLIRISRNAMAACPDAQDFLCHRFDLVAPFLENITRFHTLNDPEATLLSRSAAQMLSNLITANRNVQRQMWPRIVICETSQDKLLLKLLSSPDTATQSAAQILLINFLRTQDWIADADERCHQLCTTPAGQELLESLLGISESIMLRTASETQAGFDQGYESGSDNEGLEESLGFVYTVFATLFERGCSSFLISAPAPVAELSSSSCDASEADLPMISSSQLTLLKLLDSWLHLQQKSAVKPPSISTDGTASPWVFELVGAPPRRGSAEDRALRLAGLAGLIDAFIYLSRFARSAMAGGIAKDGVSADQQPQDRRLIGVHHGLLLLLQSLLSISMAADGWSIVMSSVDEPSKPQTYSFVDLSRALLSDMRGNDAFIDELVALLDQTHQYAPALSPFRPRDATFDSKTGTAAPGDGSQDRPLPRGHALSSTGRAAHESKGTQPGYGFDHLKRDIVRVLGSLVYTPKQAAQLNAELSHTSDEGARTSDYALTMQQIRHVQDRTRVRGGLFHVLNMTVLDERNPCKWTSGPRCVCIGSTKLTTDLYV